jgi:ATP-binding cassette subfamily B protein
MDLLRIHARVLALLGPEARLGWLLALGNLALATSQFAEPVLFGRIIDALTGSSRAGGPGSPGTVAWLVAAWVGFGLFAIAVGVSVALHADRLAHRRRHAVLASYF